MMEVPPYAMFCVREKYIYALPGVRYRRGTTEVFLTLPFERHQHLPSIPNWPRTEGAGGYEASQHKNIPAGGERKIIYK
jgi:hypothetical protein